MRKNRQILLTVKGFVFSWYIQTDCFILVVILHGTNPLLFIKLFLSIGVIAFVFILISGKKV